MKLRRLLRRKEQPKAAIDSSYELLRHIEASIRASAAGITVTHDEALKCPAVAVSVKVISESVAQLPFNIFRVGEDGERKVVASNPVQKLLSVHGRPNSWQSSFEFRRWATRRVALYGNAYALKQSVNGVLTGLIPIARPVAVEQNALGELVYKVTGKHGDRITYSQDSIFHLRGESDDALVGIDPIMQNAEAIGLALAQDRFAGKMFSNGVKLSGVLELPGVMSEVALKNLKESFEQQYGSVENAHRVLVLENGVKFNAVSMTLNDAQLLESRKLQRSIVCALWRVPPHMVGDLEHATFSNIEELNRHLIEHTVMTWLDMWQQNIEQQLLTPGQRVSHIAKFNVNAFLRGNATSRAQFYNAGITGTWMSPNEVREYEDLPPRDGGDQYVNPNITPKPDNGPANDNAGKPEKSPER